VGNLFGGGSKTTTVNQNTSTTPWAPQGAAVQNLFNTAQGIYNNQSGVPFWPGNFYTGINSAQTAGANSLITGGQTAQSYAPALYQTGAQGLEAMPGIMGTGYNLASSQGAPTSATNAIIGATPGALSYDNTGLSGAQSALTGNTPQSLVDAAGTFTNNPLLQGQIDAVGTDIRRNLGENVLPTLNAQAIAGGNLNSSRAGAAEAIAQRGAEENLANAAANIRGNAYNTGLQLASGQTGQNIQGNLGLASGGLGLAGAGNSATSAAASALWQNGMTNAQGAGLLSTGLNDGTNLINSGNNLTAAGGQEQLQGGGIFQQDANAANQAGYQQFLAGQQYPWSQLDNLSNILQARSWGQNSDTTGTQTSTQTDSGMGNLIGGTSMLGSLFGGNSSSGGILGSMGNMFGGSGGGGFLGSLFGGGNAAAGLADGVSTAGATAGETVPLAAADAFASAGAGAGSGIFGTIMSYVPWLAALL
jgi:hypothetical protein